MTDLAVLIQQHFIERKWTLSLAESCTGGSLAARLTQQAGCSKYFLGSIITYSNQLKINVLGVEPHLLESTGAVSRLVVDQMAQGVLRLSQSTYSLAVSGIAGPTGGSLEKPVGTVWGAIAGPCSWTGQFQFLGSRQQIIEQSVEAMLSQLWILLESQKNSMK